MPASLDSKGALDSDNNDDGNDNNDQCFDSGDSLPKAIALVKQVGFPVLYQSMHVL